MCRGLLSHNRASGRRRRYQSWSDVRYCDPYVFYRSSGVVTLKLGPQQLHKLEEQQYILSDGNAYQNGMFFRLRVERNMATKAQIVRLMWQRLKIRRYKLDLMDTTMAGRELNLTMFLMIIPALHYFLSVLGNMHVWQCLCLLRPPGRSVESEIPSWMEQAGQASGDRYYCLQSKPRNFSWRVSIMWPRLRFWSSRSRNVSLGFSFNSLNWTPHTVLPTYKRQKVPCPA